MSSTVDYQSYYRRQGTGGHLLREEVRQIQRSRMLAATLDAVEEVGFQGMTVGRVIGRARVSRKTFYDVFTNREDCFSAAFEETLAQARQLASEAYSRGTCWREGVRFALQRLLELAEEEPTLAKICVVESTGGGKRVAALRAQMLSELRWGIDLGRREAGEGLVPPRLTADAVVGGILAVLHASLLRDGGRRVTRLLNEMMSIVVLPYLGEAVAREELSAPPHRRSGAPRRRLDVSELDPLDGLNIRLTYRTLRVLVAIKRRPGANNREVAEAAGIVDQGQMSRLLYRLAGLDLIENRGDGQPKGRANAWWLTARGIEIEVATRPGPEVE